MGRCAAARVSELSPTKEWSRYVAQPAHLSEGDSRCTPVRRSGWSLKGGPPRHTEIWVQGCRKKHLQVGRWWPQPGFSPSYLVKGREVTSSNCAKNVWLRSLSCKNESTPAILVFLIISIQMYDHYYHTNYKYDKSFFWQRQWLCNVLKQTNTYASTIFVQKQNIAQGNAVRKYKNNSSRGTTSGQPCYKIRLQLHGGKMLLGFSQNSIMIVRRNQSFPSNLESRWLSWSVKARGAKRPAHHFFSSNPFFDSCWFSFFFFVGEFKKPGMGGGGPGLLSDAINVLTEQLSNVPWSHLHREGGDSGTAPPVSHVTRTKCYFMPFK